MLLRSIGCSLIKSYEIPSKRYSPSGLSSLVHYLSGREERACDNMTFFSESGLTVFHVTQNSSNDAKLLQRSIHERKTEIPRETVPPAAQNAKLHLAGNIDEEQQKEQQHWNEHVSHVEHDR